MIDFSNGHATIVGMTQSGKTHATMTSLLHHTQGVIFFNPQLVMAPGYTIADKKNNIEQILSALKRGKKINYRPDRATRWIELTYIIEQILAETDKNKLDIVFVADECHLAKRHSKEANSGLVELATTGLSRGIRLASISQRPAEMEYTLLTQSTKFVMFEMEFEGEYLKRKGLPSELINERVRAAGKYHFVEYEKGILSDAKKI